MPKAASDAKLMIQSLTKAYTTTPMNLKKLKCEVWSRQVLLSEE